MKNVMLATACTAAMTLVAGAAQADTIAANLSGSYANFSNGGGSIWNVDGAAAMPFGGDWGVEVTGGYHHVAVGGGADLGNVGGSLYWRLSDVRLAATVNYADLSLLHLTTYGVGGEWDASQHWTVSAHGGGATGQFGVDGGYVGGDVKYYFTPDIAVNGGVDYINLSGFDHVTTEDVRAEWLVSETTPVSVFGGYAHAESGGAGSEDIFFIGVKLYTNDGSSTLVDRQRNGNLGYIAGVPYFGQEL